MAAAAFTVGCANDANKAHAYGIFRSLCPADYRVNDIIPVCKNEIPYCRWLASYTPHVNGQNQNAPGGVHAQTAFQLLTVFKPVNVNVTGHFRSDPDKYCIEFGVNFGPNSCLCVNPDFKLASTTSTSVDRFCIKPGVNDAIGMNGASAITNRKATEVKG